MVIFLAFIGFYLLPVFCIVFCLNLVSTFKKVKYEESTSKNTLWLTVSFILIIWTLGAIGASNGKL